MPYSKDSPPDQIKGLPKKAQEIWIAAYNSAHEQYKGDEEKASATAWTAVKYKYEKVKDKWRAKMELSLTEIETAIRGALREKFGKKENSNGALIEDSSYSYLRDVYANYIIFERGDKYYKISYSLLDGEVKFGDEAQEVKQEWVEARSKQAQLDEGIEESCSFGVEIGQMAESDPEGTAWEVTICQPGFTKNGWYIPEEVLKTDVGLFENVDVNLFDFDKNNLTHLPDNLFSIKNLLTKKKVGWIDNVRFVAGQGVKGVLHFLDSAKWLGKNLLSAKQQGKSGYGLSFDYAVRSKQDTVKGKAVRKLLKFLQNELNSVDIVTRPAAGGRFERAVASMPPNSKEELFMDKEKLWQLIQEKRPDLLVGKDLAGTTDEEVVALAKMAMEPPKIDDTQTAQKKQADPPKTTLDNKDQDLMKEVKMLRCDMALKDRLSTSDLPPYAKERIRKQFQGRVFEDQEIDAAIGEEKDYLAKMAEATKPKPQEGEQFSTGFNRGSNLYVGLNTMQKAQMALDRMLGFNTDEMKDFRKKETLEHQPYWRDLAKMSVQDVEGFSDVPSFTGIREAYNYFTGDIEGIGEFRPDRFSGDLRAQMNITSTTFTYLLGNTLGRRLVKQYAAIVYGEDILISFKKSVKDFRQQEAVLIGGFPDLSTVDPEVADYQEIATVTDEESTYTLLQKGNILTISRKYIINDDIGTIQRKIDGLGRAAKRTHAKYVWNKLIDNATCSDTTAWFTSGHGNLTTNTLSIANALTARNWLAKTTEKDSSERLGLLTGGAKPVLIYPVDLRATAKSIQNDDHYYTSNDLTTKTANPLKNDIEIFECILMTDATDWAMVNPKNVSDIIEMGYLGGRTEPLLFVADSEQSERMFLADDRRYKILHEYAGAMIDYRSGYKSENP